VERAAAEGLSATVKAVRQVSESAELHRPLEPSGQVVVAVRGRLESLGIEFEEDPDPGLPSPSQWAAIELESGVQFAFEHFYMYSPDQLTVRSEPGSVSPAERMEVMRQALELDERDVTWIEPQWPFRTGATDA